MKITYVNEDEIKKNNFILRKIAAMVVLMTPLLLTGCGKDVDLEEVKNKYSVENIDELDSSEKTILEMLKEYEQAYNDYKYNMELYKNRTDTADKDKRRLAGNNPRCFNLMCRFTLQPWCYAS